MSCARDNLRKTISAVAAANKQANDRVVLPIEQTTAAARRERKKIHTRFVSHTSSSLSLHRWQLRTSQRSNTKAES